jgi:DOPA 4,5-dioxygenase
MIENCSKNTEIIRGYHAHVYYDVDEKQAAADLRELIASKFKVAIGRWHDTPVGPHPRGSYQIAFKPALFGNLIPFLMLNHGELTVFIHPITDDDLADHRDRPLWLGESETLDLSIF